MSGLSFVKSLLESGAVGVSAPPGMPEEWGEAVVELDRIARPELTGEAPALVERAGAWGLSVLYRACQLLAYRDVDGEQVRAMLATPCPERASPSVCYSVDLSLRYLPDVMSLARGIAPGDPLVASLLTLAEAWPLSSVGIKGLNAMDVGPFAGHPSLRQLHVDRIIERCDVMRLGDASILESVRAAIGGFPELAPGIAAALAAAPAPATSVKAAGMGT